MGNLLAKYTRLADRLLFLFLCCLFFFIPFATSPAVISGAIALAIWIFSGMAFRDRDKWLKQKWTLPVLVFMLLPWAGLLWTNDIAGGLDFAKKSYYWLYAFAIASLAFSRHSITVLLNAFIVGLTLFSIIALLQISNLIPLVKGLPTISTKSITTSLLLVFGVLILSFYFIEANGIKRKAIIVSVMILFFLTLSVGTGRAGYLAYILLSPVVMYNIFGKKIIKVIAVTAITIAVLFLSPSVQERTDLVFSDISNYQQMDPNTSVGLRLHMWTGAVKIFLENPIIGVGTGGYQSAMKKYETPNLAPIHRDFSDPHNSYLYMAANFGILGIISLFWLFLSLLKNGWRNRHNITGFAILSYTLVLMIGSLTGTQILSLATAFLFAVFTGLQKHLESENKK
ncbi:MAG: O-antigen ligase family protein [Nitrospirota bacterium]|nr:O-antigen ligase family protein [Nitrospirota bacterium]